MLAILGTTASCGAENIKRLQVREVIYPMGPPARDLDDVAERRASRECRDNPSIDGVEITVILEQLDFANLDDPTASVELERQTSTIDC